MSWRVIEVATNSYTADALSDVLTYFDATSVSLEDAFDDPLYEPPLGETPIWPHVICRGIFTENTETKPIIDFLKQSFGRDLQCRSYSFADENWQDKWQAYFKPICFGNRLWICPSHATVSAENAVVLHLDPGLAFGTGSHPTTALCLEWLATHVKKDDIVIDYGCGSGILALAAIKLQAAHVQAVDIDPDALTATKNNADKNAIGSEQLTLLNVDDPLSIKADILIANILANPLLTLVEKFAALTKVDGKLVLSGILIEQVDSIKDAYAPFFSFVSMKTIDEWVLLDFHRKPY